MEKHRGKKHVHTKAAGSGIPICCTVKLPELMVPSHSSIFWQFPVQVLLTTDLHLSTQNETHQGTLLAIQFLFLAVIQENHIRKLQSLLIEMGLLKYTVN